MNFSVHRLFILSFFITFTSLSAQQDRYTLTFDEETPRVIKVRAQLNLEDTLLYMSPNSSKADRWPQFISDLEVRGAEGEVLEVHRPDSLTWIIKGVGKGRDVQLTYNLRVLHDKEEWPGGIDGVAFSGEQGTMSSGRALFVMNGQNKKDIRVHTNASDGWKVSTSWESHIGEDDTYLADDLQDLQEAFVFAGTHEEMSIDRGDFRLKFILGGKHIQDKKEEYARMANEILDYYIALMGGGPRSATGESPGTCLVMLNEGDTVDGEVIGDHISILLDPKADAQTQMIGWFIFAHEFFHLWNGKTLVFQGTTSDWFKEGISNYYTLKALYQVGYLNKESVRGTLNGLFYQRYISDPGLGVKTPVDAAEGFSKDQHWGLIYSGGLFSGICMDLKIRNQSNNDRSLDDMMRYFYEEFGGTGNLITNETIITTSKEMGFPDFDVFFEHYLKGTQQVPLAKYLRYAGFEVSTEEGQLQLQDMKKQTDLQKGIQEGFFGAM